MERRFSVDPVSQCGGDCAHCNHNLGADFTPAEMTEIKKNLEKDLERYKHFTGPHKCMNCNFKWISEPGQWETVNQGGTIGQYLKCPHCGSLNVVGDSAKPPRIEVVFPDRPPGDEIARFENFRRTVMYPRPEDTCGDLSIVTASKKSPEKVRQSLRTMANPGDSVGDLSVATDKRESLRAQADAAGCRLSR